MKNQKLDKLMLLIVVILSVASIGIAEDHYSKDPFKKQLDFIRSYTKENRKVIKTLFYNHKKHNCCHCNKLFLE